MNKRSQASYVEDLICQDEEVASFKFEEFRMNLEQTICSLEKKSAFYGRLMLCLALVWLLIILAIPLVFGLEVGPGKPTSFLMAWLILGNLTLLIALSLGVVHWFKHRPALAKAKDDLQQSVIADLQNQVTELSRRSDKE